MDNLVVIVAPSPDDEEGLLAMNELLEPKEPGKKPIDQPLVVLNYHMLPVSGLAARFEVAYHLRLLSVQFMTGNNAPEYFKKWEEEKIQRIEIDDNATSSNVLYGPDGEVLPRSPDSTETEPEVPEEEGDVPEEDAALEAAMKHAHDMGVNQGVTRAMVIRAYPRLVLEKMLNRARLCCSDLTLLSSFASHIACTGPGMSLSIHHLTRMRILKLPPRSTKNHPRTM
jgi:hypothetical protein